LKKLAEAEEENARLKAVVAKNEDDLRVLGEHSAVMECEASDASKARDRARAELATLSEEFQGLQAKHSALQESHAILQAEHTELQETIPSSRRSWGNSRKGIQRASSS
jgi:chromosome segregation ATPase